MQLRLINIFLLFIFSSSTFLYSETFNFKRFYISYDKSIEKNKIEKLIDIINKAEDFFINKFDYVPKAKLDFFIFNTVNEMMESLKIPSWIGAYFNNNYVYLQPVEILEKKNILEKIIFIEYSHYYINDISNNNCPLWLNEMLSSFYSMQFLNENKTYNKDIKIIKKFSELTDNKKIFKDYEFSRSFYYSSELFINFLNNKYYQNFFDMILLKLKAGYDFNDTFLEITGEKIDYLYESDFIRSFNKK